MNHPPYIHTAAGFSDCNLYRYTLRRRWKPRGRHVLWVMLNPSTADDRQDDPTIRRCAGFSHAWGYAGYDAANIFALRSTDPQKLYEHDDPVGPGNEAAILGLAREASLIVCAWGNHGALQDRGAQVVRTLHEAGFHLYCLALNSTTQQPTHPLYQPSDRRPLRLRLRQAVP